MSTILVIQHIPGVSSYSLCLRFPSQYNTQIAEESELPVTVSCPVNERVGFKIVDIQMYINVYLGGHL